MVKSRKPFASMLKSFLGLPKAKTKKLAKRFRQIEKLEQRELFAGNFSSAVQGKLATMFFENQTQYNAAGAILTSKLGSGSGGSSSGGTVSGESGTPVNTVEQEPNGSIIQANFVPLGNLPSQSNVVNVSGQMTNRLDEDYFSFDLKKGDILDLRVVVSVGTPSTTLLNSSGTELLTTKGIYLQANGNLPSKTPRFSTGSTTLTYVIDTDGRYFLRLADAAAPYSLNLRTYRSTYESQPIGTKQVLFLDFDGASLRTDLVNLEGLSTYGATSVPVKGLAKYLPQLGMTASDYPSLVDNITKRVEKKLRFQLAADTNNGFYSQTGNPGDFDIQVINSSNSPDVYGQANVSRVIVGGTQTELGIDPATGLLGIAQRVDIGNFDHEDSALVMLDILIADAINTAGVPRSGTSTTADVFAELLSSVIAHEAGHTLGGVHQDPNSSVTSIMDQFYDPVVFDGSGRDGIFGTADDKPISFINDEFSPTQGAVFGGGVDNAGQMLAFGMSTGKVGFSISGTIYNDKNRNARLEGGENGLAGWTVYADNNNNNVPELGEVKTVTDGSGNFNLAVGNGTYNIRVVRPAGWIASTSAEDVHTVVVSGGNVTTNLGNFLPNSTVTGYKWLDINGDGIRDTGEPGLAGVYIYLDLDGDGRPDLGEPATVSAADGSYTLTPPSAGTYSIREVVEAGYVQTFPASGVNVAVYDGSNPLRGYDFGNTERNDWGDAPAPYPTTRAQNGAAHGFTPGLRLGTQWDAEQDGQPSTNADGDNTNGLTNSSGAIVNDEDGVSLLAPIVRGDSQNAIQVTVTNTTGSPAYLQAWIDFNGNGVWGDSGEQIITNASVVNGNNVFNFTTPVNAVANLYTRFRLSQDQNLLPTGKSKTGEVEDYLFTSVKGPRTLLQDDSFTVARNSRNNVFDVLANDFQLQNNPWTIVSKSAGSNGGTISIVDNKIQYSPALGFVGTESFTYTATNALGYRETAKVNVGVTIQFNDPFAVDDSFDLPTNSVGFPLSVLANDIEGKGGALIVSSFTAPNKGGSLTIGSGGQSIRYTPARNFGGTETFSYTAIDATGKTTTANVTLHTLSGDRDDDVVSFSFAFFNAGDNPATATPITSIKQGSNFQAVVYVDDLRPNTAPFNQGVYAAYLDVLYSSGLVSPLAAGAADPLDFAASFVSPYVQGFSGTSQIPGVIDEFGAFVGSVNSFFKPDKIPLGVIQFNARSAGLAEFVGDPADASPSDDVVLYNIPNSPVSKGQITYGRSSIEIVPTGVEFPLAVDDSPATINVGVTTSVNVLANDVVGTQGPLRISSISQPANGQASIFDNNTPNDTADDVVRYTPNTNFNGVDQFQYTIIDQRGYTSTATVTLHIGDTTADDQAQLRLSVTDLAGTPVDTITVGSQFQLRGFVQDLRTPSALSGVFAAFQDVLYNSNLVKINTQTAAPGFSVTYDNLYSNGTSGDVLIPGLINEIGSVENGNTALGSTERLQWTITLTATAAGLVNFVGDPADIKPFHDTLLFNPTTPLTPSQIRYVNDSVTILPASGSGGSGEGLTNPNNRFDVNNDGFVSPIDVLILVNAMNSGKGGLLSGGSSGGTGSGEGEGGINYVDVNGDNYLSPIDVLWVINRINAGTSGSGEGEGEASAVMPTQTTLSTSALQKVDVPFASNPLNAALKAAVYGPLPSSSNRSIVSSLDEYFAAQSDANASSASDFELDLLANDVLKRALI